MPKSLNPKKGEALWKERFELARSNQSRMFKRFSNYYDALYAQVNVTPSPWRSKVYVPILARQTWALVSKFLVLKPGFEVRVLDSEDTLGNENEDIEQKAEKAQRKLEYDYGNPCFDESMRDKLFSPLLDATVTGTGMAKVPWKVDTKYTYKRLNAKDGVVDLTKEAKTTKKVEYNDLEPINIFNVFVSPAATGLYFPKCPWIIIKEYKTVAELEAANKSKNAVIYKNLDKLNGKASFDDETDSLNRSRNRLLSQQDQVDKTVDMVTLYECYDGTENKIYTYAEGSSSGDDEGWVLLREQVNPYWHGKYPLVKFHVKKKPFQFWGEGLFETTYRLQAVYNDAVNHFMDQWNLAENSMLMVPETANVNDYVIEPGGTITYRGDKQPTQFKHASPDGNLLQVVLGLMDQAIEGVTVSNYATGLPNSSTDKTKGTATGILRLQEAAGDLVTFMRENFSQSVLQIGRFWLSNNQQYMTQPVVVQANNKGKVDNIEVSPQDIQGEMELLIDDASMQPTSKEEIRNNYTAFTQQLLGLKAAADAQHMQLGTSPLALDFVELSEDTAEKYGMKNFQSVLIPEDQLQGLMQQKQQEQQMAMAAGQQQEAPNPPKQPSESLNYKDAPEDVKRQIEAQAGLEPSQMVPMQPQNPAADQATVDMAHQLAAQGHLDASILQHLSPMQPQVMQPPEVPNVQ